MAATGEIRWPPVGRIPWPPSYEGAHLDYALKLDGELRLYVEAKGLNENLNDWAL